MKWLIKQPKLRIIFELIILGLIVATVLFWLIPSQPQLQLENLRMLSQTSYQKIDQTTLRCQLCAFNCFLQEGEIGECGNVINKGGKLFYVR